MTESDAIVLWAVDEGPIRYRGEGDIRLMWDERTYEWSCFRRGDHWWPEAGFWGLAEEAAGHLSTVLGRPVLLIGPASDQEPAR